MKYGRSLSRIKNAVCVLAAVCATAIAYFGVGGGRNERIAVENLGTSSCGVLSAGAEAFRYDSAADIAALSSYDGREYGLVTPVRDQRDSDLCWAYASVSASEASILKSRIDPNATVDMSLSPEALGYARYNRPQDPLGNTKAVSNPSSNWYNSSGDARYSATMMSQWCGPIDGTQSATVDPFANARFHLDNAVHVKSKEISDIKLAIAEYGAVTFSYNNVRETEYYNPKLETSSSSYPHACTLIGWDDDIPADRFKPNGASRDGGWLVKNSYLSLEYFWLSYDNTSDSVYAFDFTAKETYDCNYFYDYGLDDSLNYTINAKKACEIFEAKGGTDEKTEYLKAVNVGFIGKNVTVTVDVYVDLADESDPESGRRAGGGQAVFGYGGFRTVELDAPVALENGKDFACVVGVSDPANSAVICNMLGKNGTPSFIYKNYWQFANNCTPRIKAFTKSEKSGEPPHVHSFVSADGAAATCTEDGVRAHEKCSACGKLFEDGVEKELGQLIIKALGHDIVRHEATAATCTEDGCAAYETCSRCEYNTYSEVPALGHDYGAWTVVKQPTVDECGEERRVCARDGTHVETRVLPKLVPPPAETEDGGEDTGEVEPDGSNGDGKKFDPLWIIPITAVSIAAAVATGIAVYRKSRKRNTK